MVQLNLNCLETVNFGDNLDDMNDSDNFSYKVDYLGSIVIFLIITLIF